MINYEAIEIGARVLIEDGRYGVPWEDASEDDRAEVMARVRAILEAAAPYMLATPVIPAGAVESALVARREFRNKPGRDNAVNMMRAALEAAAPHMLGAAWAEGCRKGLGTNPGWEDEVLARNPYRTSK